MLKIVKDQWHNNREHLKEKIHELLQETDHIDYGKIVALAFEECYNRGIKNTGREVDTKKITEIDNGDYHGTLIYVIPLDTCQPAEYEYLMTYVAYGSCSGCDTLQAILEDDNKERREIDLLKLCEDVLTNTIIPFSDGWAYACRFM